MFDNMQFREQIIRPALLDIGLYSLDAEELLIATMAHESQGGKYLVQTQGPALGIYQMEPATYNWIVLDISRSSPMIFQKLMPTTSRKPLMQDMVFNLKYATQIARLRYFIVPKELPKHDDLDGMWDMYKTNYNSSKGDATKIEFVTDYHHFIGKAV